MFFNPLIMGVNESNRDLLLRFASWLPQIKNTGICCAKSAKNLRVN